MIVDGQGILVPDFIEFEYDEIDRNHDPNEEDKNDFWAIEFDWFTSHIASHDRVKKIGPEMKQESKVKAIQNCLDEPIELHVPNYRDPKKWLVEEEEKAEKD